MERVLVINVMLHLREKKGGDGDSKSVGIGKDTQRMSSFDRFL